MSKALDTDDNYVTFGTALDPIEEEEVARKKPITVSEQVATDENGRRRFHGAFTGGFSAGYFNTVGSKEGWTPSTFKSSRSERVGQPKGQNVTDFMDDEDIGSFGIAPQVLRPTDDFAKAEGVTSSRKRPKATQSDGPIPGVPVLEQIIEPVKETVGIRILIKMGWRPGQGVGPRVGKTIKEKSRRRKKEKDSEQLEIPTIVDDEIEIIENEGQKKRTYGCQLPPEITRSRKDSAGSSDDDFDSDVLYAPEDVDSPLCNPKENTFGLGYKGLDRSSLVSSSGHVDLFGTQLKFRGDNKTSGVTGEAFGIGAFEEPDEDVYSREDLSQYDFELETMEERRARKYKEIQAKAKKSQSNGSLSGFILSKSSGTRRKFFPPPHLPPNFEPVHSQRKSRFETAPPVINLPSIKRGLERHSLTVQERQILLGEETSAIKSPGSTDIVDPVITIDDKNDATPSLRPEDDPSIIERVERIKKFVQVLQAHSAAKSDDVATLKSNFKPFSRNPEKQDRYEKYLTLVAAGFQDCVKELQPLEMTEWERDREKLEFERAADIYKPLSGIMSSRFVSAKSHDISHIVPEKEILKEKDATEDPKVAARLNLFGKLTHETVEWHPDKLLCKRFNIKDPYPDSKFVGLRGGPSSKSVKTIFEEPQVVAVPVAVVPKKSLFDNLDFSKPPPGLFPGNSINPRESEPPPPGTGADSSHQTQTLDFQTNSNTDEKENVPVKASLDLFKEIFADSSESEDESSADALQVEISTRTNKIAVEQNDKRNDSNGKSKERDDYYKDTTQPLKDKRSEVRSNERSKDNERLSEKVSGKKGIFDNLDLSKLSKGSESKKEGRNCPLSNTSAENREREDDEDDDLLYGPRVPCPGKPLSTFIPNSKPQSLSQHPLPSSTSMTSLSMKTSLTNKDDVVWVEKDAVSKSRTKSKLRHSAKKVKKSKSKKSKSRHKEKHKKSKKHKHKRNKLSKSQSGHSDSSSSSSADEVDAKIRGDGSSDDSSSSITIHGSLDQKALLAQLKKISRSN